MEKRKIIMFNTERQNNPLFMDSSFILQISEDCTLLPVCGEIASRERKGANIRNILRNKGGSEC